MDILVTLNSKYLHPLKVMLKSLFLNNHEEKFTIYLMQSSMEEEELLHLKTFVNRHNGKLEIIYIDDQHFKDAPVLLHYTKEMYYRILAYKFLPKDLERILYLDPDILVLNPVKELYQMDINEYMYAAAYHDKISVKEINRIRLLPYDIDAYYNSGVLLMNLELQRKLIEEEAIYEFIKKNRARLIMPDQDVINALFSKKIKNLDETLYNYDARFYNYYRLKTNGKCDMDYVINHTVILHFCGKKKPWQKGYAGKFHSLYKHYEKLALKG
jgi:lipopolysaccharide biosynthesis glycosyltransferase